MVGLLAAPAVAPLMQRRLPPYIVEPHDACANDDGERASLLLAVYNGMEGVGSQGGGGGRAGAGRPRRGQPCRRPFPKSLCCSGSLSPPVASFHVAGPGRRAATAAHPPPRASLSPLSLSPPSPPSHLAPLSPDHPATTSFSHLTSRSLPALAGFDLGLSPANTLAQRGRGGERDRKRKERCGVVPLSLPPHITVSLWLIAPPSVGQNMGFRGRCRPEGGETGRGRVAEGVWQRACGTLSLRENSPEF
jgi:hypothetical protein